MALVAVGALMTVIHKRFCFQSCSCCLIRYFVCLSYGSIFLLSSCSSGHYGLVSAEVIDTEGARLVEVETFGADVRTLAADAGFTLGWGRRVYIYPSGTLGPVLN